jgi:hypothetical protein
MLLRTPRIWAALTGLIALLLLVSPATATVINLDIDTDGVAHGDDNGVLSSPGGTTWNPIGIDFLNDVNIFDVSTEFGAATAVDITLDADGSYDARARPIALYEGGATGTLTIENLSATSLYDLAIYTTDPNLSVSVTDAGGAHAGATGGTFALELPGDEGEEYILFHSLAPLDLGGGVLGLQIATQGPTKMAGFQLLEVPEPTSAALVGFGALWLACFRRRSR